MLSDINNLLVSVAVRIVPHHENYASVFEHNLVNGPLQTNVETLGTSRIEDRVASLNYLSCTFTIACNGWEYRINYYTSLLI